MMRGQKWIVLKSVCSVQVKCQDDCKDACVIPKFMQQTVTAINTKYVDSVGIYRKSGLRTREMLLSQYCTSGFSGSELDNLQVSGYDVADSVKSFLRSLRSPIIPHNVHSQLFSIAERVNVDFDELTLCLSKNLSFYSLCLLRYLFDHFNTVANNSEINRMTAPNIAICVAPCLFASGPSHGIGGRGSSMNPHDLKSAVKARQGVLEVLINNPKIIQPHLSCNVGAKHKHGRNLCDNQGGKRFGSSRFLPQNFTPLRRLTSTPARSKTRCSPRNVRVAEPGLNTEAISTGSPFPRSVTHSVRITDGSLPTSSAPSTSIGVSSASSVIGRSTSNAVERRITRQMSRNVRCHSDSVIGKSAATLPKCKSLKRLQQGHRCLKRGRPNTGRVYQKNIHNSSVIESREHFSRRSGIQRTTTPFGLLTPSADLQQEARDSRPVFSPVLQHTSPEHNADYSAIEKEVEAMDFSASGMSTSHVIEAENIVSEDIDEARTTPKTVLPYSESDFCRSEQRIAMIMQHDSPSQMRVRTARHASAVQLRDSNVAGALKLRHSESSLAPTQTLSSDGSDSECITHCRPSIAYIKSARKGNVRAKINKFNKLIDVTESDDSPSTSGVTASQGQHREWQPINPPIFETSECATPTAEKITPTTRVRAAAARRQALHQLVTK